MLLEKLCQALDQEAVPYAIVGGYAVALHGALRGTVDIDFVTEWTLGNLQGVERAMKNLSLVSRLPLDANLLFQFRDEYREKRNLIAWNFYNPARASDQVDLIVTYDLAKAKVSQFIIHGTLVKVLSKKNLIQMKKESGRAQDIEDIKALEKLDS